MLRLNEFAFTAFNNYHMFIGWGLIGLAFVYEARVHNGIEEFHWRRLALGIALIIFALSFLWIEILPFTSSEQRVFLRMSAGLLMATFLIYVGFCVVDMLRAAWNFSLTILHRLLQYFPS